METAKHTAEITEAEHLLDGVRHIHFIGCGGSGMYPLIQILAAKGYEISGSDVLEGSIPGYERAMGVRVTIGHSAENVQGADLVVYSAAIARTNVEIEAARSQGIPTVERSVLLGYVSRLFANCICVSGTHGKTTTTSLITTALELSGRDPSAVIGGKLPLIHGYGKCGKSDNIVIEACEFSRTFLHLAPSMAVLLNIDNDHLDYYGTMGNLKQAFGEFAALARDAVFANADDANTMEVAASLARPVRTFGIRSENAEFRAVNLTEPRPGFYGFDLCENGTVTGRIQLAVPGRHNIYNALAMCAVCRTLGLSAAECAAAADSFRGAGRRFEVYGECNGALVVDDYAHHPTELEATLKTARELGYKRVVAVHQPFTYSRTKLLMDDFVRVLQIADVVVLTPILGSREVDDGSVKTADLAARIPGAVEVGSLAAAADWVRRNCGRGDLVITLGCGDVYKASKMMVGQPV
jgi:UDP-N-acetylmuramate--alanine ligase